MATTQKRKKKKSTKKTTKKTTTRRTAKVETLDALDKDDMHQIKDMSNDVEIAKMRMALEEQNHRNLELEFALLQKKIADQRQVVIKKAELYENRKAAYREYVASIGSKYGLKEGQGLAYNPETGDIVRD